MSALYQRARPFTFDQVVGQEHVKDVLASAVAKGLTGHAYLFSGPRGVGKTTTARLMAMAVNCERQDPAERPCGECESCRLVREGSHPDVIELDAASNNSVDDVRALREQVGLASLRGGTRVWILDEAHMLSRAAANALLKTLEEPPPGLMFVLATTEPEKLPPTILSRCQHFRFRRLTDAEILGKLEMLCEQAGVKAEREALAMVSRAADGAMRDAESLLERLLVGGGEVTAVDAEDALGLAPRESLAALADALVAAELGRLLPGAGDLYRAGFAPRTVAEQLARTLRDRLHEALASGAGVDQARLVAVIHALDDEHERFIRRDDLYSLEVALIKSAMAGTAPAEPAAANPEPAAASAAQLAPADTAPTRPVTQDKTPQRRGPGSQEPSGGREPQPAASEQSEPQPASPQPRGPRATTSEPSPGPSPARGSFSWHAVRTAAAPQLKAFLQPAKVEEADGVITLEYGENWRFHFDQVVARRDELETLVEKVAGPGYEVDLRGPRGSSGGGRRGRGRRAGPAASSDEKTAKPATRPDAAPEANGTDRDAPSADHRAPAAEPESPAGSPAASDAARNAEPREPEPPHDEETSLYGTLPEDFWDSAPVASGQRGQAAPSPVQGAAETAGPGDEPADAGGASLAQLQRLFPGRVIEFQPATVPEEANEAPEAPVDEAEGYDDEGQDRLGFGAQAPGDN